MLKKNKCYVYIIHHPMILLYKIMIGITIVMIIILLLGFIILTYMYKNNNVVYPGTINKCPDNWDIYDNNCTVPNNNNNNNNVGYLPKEQYGTHIPFNDKNQPWDICSKKKWCNKYNINWDTVRNTNSC